ncbi:coiled-coil domain-containing protein [Nonomuraea sp. LPB2021202275-12-8]|uniref:coiled-coil domain-containing protein n=1 Tax=Nonomuraea sp. LPB2021202275-12-8 TaxID=3120159 RepID=UPI00300CFAEB
MAVASSADRRRGPLRARTTAPVRVLASGLAVALLLVVPVTAGHADPKPTVKQLEKELADLQKESDKLIEDYYHGRREQQKAEKAEKAAREKLDAAQKVYDRESTELRALAIAEYTGGRPNQLTLVAGTEEPTSLMSRLALTEFLVSQQEARLSGFAQVRDGHKQAQQEAAARAEELDATADDLDGRRKKAEKLIEKIRDKIDQLHKAPGRRSDGTFLPQLPGGSDNITPRMRLVKTLIEKRFDVPYGIGCYRAIQDGGQHPLGRACDFMLSRGGAMPSAAEIERGNEIAEWAIKNAKRLGIMYIIYRQRIWHVSSGAWRVMTDRGGTTANHYDHPHISVY